MHITKKTPWITLFTAVLISTPTMMNKAYAIPTWQHEYVDKTSSGGVYPTGAGLYTSLALDKSGFPHISYQDGYHGYLMYAWFDGTSWHIETVDKGLWVGFKQECVAGNWTSLALDKSGFPHISYMWNGYGLRYAWLDQTGWHTETVDSSITAGEYSSLALDSAGNPHISYYEGNNGALMYAEFDGTGWAYNWVYCYGVLGGYPPPKPVGLYTSLALDSAGNPHISHYFPFHSSLLYSWLDGTGWHTVDLPDTSVPYPKVVNGAYTSLVLDKSGNPHISYYDMDNQHLGYVWSDGTSWHTELVDGSTEVGWYTSLALDSAGNPHISYYDDNNGALKYAWFEGTKWYIETVEKGQTWPGVGWYTSLALDSAGNPHISYYDARWTGLKYASRTLARVSVNTATGSGTAYFSSDAGTITNLQAVAESTLPTTGGKPSGVSFPDGFFTFTITDLTPGQTVTVIIQLPSIVSSGAQYWKCQNGVWFSVPKTWLNHYTISISITEGGTGDSDGSTNSVIVDPGGIAIPKPMYNSDINKDGKVDILDITIVAKAFGSKPGMPLWNASADVNNDGVINILDISMVAKDFGKTA